MQEIPLRSRWRRVILRHESWIEVQNVSESAGYASYLKRASKEHDVPIRLLERILGIESEKKFMKRRHNIYSDLRNAIMSAVREEK